MKLQLILFFAVLSLQMAGQTVATLSHNGAARVFEGANGLRNAHEAAVHGDVITLSAGTFNSVYITKAVTLRGAGMLGDERSIINGSFTINIQDTAENSLCMEGLYVNGDIAINDTIRNAQFVRIAVTGSMGGGCQQHTRYYCCRIGGTTSCLDNSDIAFYNCYVKQMPVNNNGNSSIEAINCIVAQSSLPNYINYTNCILKDKPNSSCSLVKTLSFQLDSYYYLYFYHTSLNSYIYNWNTATPSLKKVFQNIDNYDFYHAAFTTEADFTLAAQTKALKGTDGTEIGMYGGLGYTSEPSYPRITKFVVADKTDEEGKLSLDVTVTGLQ